MAFFPWSKSKKVNSNVPPLDPFSIDVAPVNNFDTTFHNLRTFLMTSVWNPLAYLYTTCGIIRTFIDIPVDDAFAKGFEINCKELNNDQHDALKTWWKDHNVTETLKKSLKWNRLYGGAAVIIDVQGQDPETPFDIASIRNSNIRFIDASMWELFNGARGTEDLPKGFDVNYDVYQSIRFNYHTIRLDRSRAMLMTGKPAPDLIRPRLRGWGLSEVECIVSALNRYLKVIDATYELITEAKIDVYKVADLMDAAIDQNALQRLISRFRKMNTMKSYYNAIVIGASDEFEQKTLSFAGMSEMMEEIRKQIASETRIPYERLFGQNHSKGLNSGRVSDSMEQYSTFVRGSIQEPAKGIMTRLLRMACVQVLGKIPQHIDIEFPPVISLTVQEEEELKTSKLNRIIAAKEAGLISLLEARESLNKENLMPVEVAETDEIYQTAAENNNFVEENRQETISEE